MCSEVVTIWEVFTETGGHWSCYDTEEEAMSAAIRYSARQDRPFLVRRQDNILYDLIEVKGQGNLFEQ